MNILFYEVIHFFGKYTCIIFFKKIKKILYRVVDLKEK